MVKIFKNIKLGSAVGIVALTLGACATPQPSQPPMFLKNPIQIAESVERLELYARPDGMSLSARDQDAVAGFLNEFARYGDGPLYMNLPNRSNPGVSQTQGLIRNMLGKMGLTGAPVQEGQYQSAVNGPSPVIISYRRLKALPRDCGINSELINTYNNQTYANFGCSASANLAAMIDDPRQLIAPHDLSPANMRRRMTIYDKYIQGENPASSHPARQEVSSSDN